MGYLGRDPDKVSHYPNLTLRMPNRRFTRLTNAFSKKLANYVALVDKYDDAQPRKRAGRTPKAAPAGS